MSESDRVVSARKGQRILNYRASADGGAAAVDPRRLGTAPLRLVGYWKVVRLVRRKHSTLAGCQTCRTSCAQASSQLLPSGAPPDAYLRSQRGPHEGAQHHGSLCQKQIAFSRPGKGRGPSP